MKQKNTIAMAVILFAMASALSFSVASQGAAESAAPTAAEIVSSARDAILSLKSYSYTLRCINKGDAKVKERHQAALKAYDAILGKIELVTRKKMRSDPKESYVTVSGVQYVKPFHLEVSLDKDDYLPELLQGSRTYYDPAVNPLEVFLKEPIVGLVFRNAVEDSDSGVVMVINWKFNLVELDCASANGAEPRFAGMEDYEGRPAYMVEMTMKNEKKPWKMPCGENTYDIPEKAWPQMNRELDNLSWRIDNYKPSEGVLKAWIDVETHFPVRKEIRFGNTIAVEHYITDIVLNKVDKKKLMDAKKPKK